MLSDYNARLSRSRVGKVTPENTPPSGSRATSSYQRRDESANEARDSPTSTPKSPPFDTSPRADHPITPMAEGDDSDLVSDLVKSFVTLEVSTMPPKNINELPDEDNEENGEAGEFTGTPDETPQSPQASEAPSDEQEEDAGPGEEVSTPPPTERRTELSPPDRRSRAPRQVPSNPSAANRRTEAWRAELDLGLCEIEKQLYQVEEKVLQEMDRDRSCQREEQLRQQDLIHSMRLELDHMARAQQASARATEAAMASIKESLDAIKRTEASKSAPPDPVEGPQDRKAQKVWISDLPPTVSRPALNTSSTSYDTPEEQRFLRKKVASSTRLSRYRR